MSAKMSSRRYPSWRKRSIRCGDKLDGLLDDDALYQQVRADEGSRYRSTLVHGRHSTPVEVLLRMLILKHLYQWSYKECEGRVADSLVLRWFCRVAFHEVPDACTLWRWEQTLRPEAVHARERPSRATGQTSQGNHRAQAAAGCHLCPNEHPSPH